jgi:signal transduction histidine kinase
MSATAQASRAQGWAALQSRLLTTLVLLYQAITLVAIAAIPLLASRWLHLPFLTAFIGHNLDISDITPSSYGTWELRSFVDTPGYRLIALDRAPIQDIRELEEALSQYAPGDQISVVLRTPQGAEVTHEITLTSFSLSDRIAYLYLPYLIGLIFMATSLWVFGLRYNEPSGRFFALFSASAAIVLAAIFDLLTTHRLTILCSIALTVGGGALINYALTFPQEDRFIERYPFLRWAGFLPAIACLLYALPNLYNVVRPDAYIVAWRLEYIFGGLSYTFFMVWMAIQVGTSPSPMVREKARFILWGTLASAAPMSLWLLLNAFWKNLYFTPYLLLPVVIFPIINAYVLLRHRLLQVDYLRNRITMYILLAVLVTVGYAALVSGLNLLLGGALQITNPYLAGGMVFILAILLLPLRTRLQRGVDLLYERGQIEYRVRLQQFTGELTHAITQSTIVGLLRRYVAQSLNPSLLHIFVYDLLSDHFVAMPDENGLVSSDLRFTSSSPIVNLLTNRREPVYLGDAQALPSGLQIEKARLSLLSAQLFIPLPGRQGLTGWLALGGRGVGEPFTDRDLNFLEALCDQAALALERTQVIANLERRMQEMNALMRVSQGTNITIAFDDMLELIYTQTNQVIPARDFRLTLLNQTANYQYHVFYLEDDERLNQLEGVPLPQGQGLESIVIQTRRPIVSEDYERECHNRNVVPAAEGLFSWVSVPLNAGAETIGVMSLGARDPSIIYTEEQVNLLQAIADQAAGAIVKARLLQESERRARQLTTLNEVARSLTSTLELSPLLNQILQSAVDILNCEAGSLFLVDSDTGELIFEVVVSPVKEDLIGKRLPPGTGLVGKSVDTRQPIIVNDVHRSRDWFAKPDEQTGFVTRDLLVVPMMIKDQVLGVLEVINRRDGLPMTIDDQELLTAFASQAAVAIENARLYTLTDQALAERVEELSVMQQIDRELNASLDIERAMRITLDWALRQSKAEAGLVGSVTDEGILIMAHVGYAKELAPFQKSLLPLDLPVIKSAINSGQIQMASPDNADGKQYLLVNSASQIVVPIRREANAIGVILLESTRPDSSNEEVLEFLTRLSDHAAIAIANAQLYAEVEAANQAKSEFVSFVSHELKTPMTSIRGFTDLLSREVVGPVNDNQANFLHTIRSNVDRMATLVSDLADVSRIEAGRLRLDFAAVSVSDICDDVTRSVKKQIDEKEQTLAVNLPEDLPNIWGDRTRLIQVLTNLMSNANKYTPNGGKITLSADLVSYQWVLEQVPGEAKGYDAATRLVHISVNDTGYGISLEDQKKIFQKFFRSENQNIRDVPGTGLGLNITKTLVEMEGGTIWFNSELGRGTTFHFTIPIVEKD